jgi:excinuclease ABC subunit B
VAILDADREGFLRTETSLVQTIGRAARNVNGRVILYADRMSNAMARAIKETDRRRAIQEEYNKANNITPETIKKAVRDIIEMTHKEEATMEFYRERRPSELTKSELVDYIKRLEKDMKQAAANLQFEKAAMLRDIIFEYKAKG